MKEISGECKLAGYKPGKSGNPSILAEEQEPSNFHACLRYVLWVEVIDCWLIGFKGSTEETQNVDVFLETLACYKLPLSF